MYGLGDGQKELLIMYGLGNVQKGLLIMYGLSNGQKELLIMYGLGDGQKGLLIKYGLGNHQNYSLCVVWPEGLVFYVWFNRWLEEVACLVNSQNNRFKKVKITKVNI